MGGYWLGRQNSLGNQNLDYSPSPTQTLQNNQPPPVLPPKGHFCNASELRTLVGLQGATGSLAGGIQLTNNGTVPCYLPWKANPTVQILDAQGKALSITNSASTTASCEQASNPYKCPQGPSFVLLPGQSASVFIQWFEWCQPKPQVPLSIRMTLPYNHEQLPISISDISGGQLADTPRCDAPNTPSSLSVGVFEPPQPQM